MHIQFWDMRASAPEDSCLQKLLQTGSGPFPISQQMPAFFEPPLICMTFSLSVLRVASVLFLTLMSYFPPLYCPMNPERCDTKSLARVNQARPRDVQAKKQPSATLPASSKPAGGTAAATRHRDAASGTKKASKPTGKAGSSSQVKANPRNTNNTNRGNGKCSSVRSRLARQNPQLPASLHGMCLCHFVWQEMSK